jgi:hypothetical protein
LPFVTLYSWSTGGGSIVGFAASSASSKWLGTYAFYVADTLKRLPEVPHGVAAIQLVERWSLLVQEP